MNFLGLAKNRRTGELIALEDPEEGVPIFFTKTGQGINTRYTSIEIEKEPFPLDDDLAEDLELFEDMLIVPSSKELQKVLELAMNGDNDDDDDDDDDEDDAPRKKAASPVRRKMVKKSRSKDDDDDDADDAADADEEEEEPKKSSIASLRKRVKNKVGKRQGK